MQDELFALIDRIDTRNFFVTVEVKKEPLRLPEGISSFLLQRLEAIERGCSARKFAFRTVDCLLYFTFFPTDRVVDGKYALINSLKKPINTL